MDELIFAVSLVLLAIAALMIMISAASADFERYDTPMTYKEECDECD